IIPRKHITNQRNPANLPLQTMIQTQNDSHTPIQGSSVGAQDATTTSGKVPGTLVPEPPSIGTSEAEFRGAIQMLTQLVATQSGGQNSALVNVQSKTTLIACS
ncbi:hypothetical protein HAX54_053335, partial [Datura stramonium]|nr:hypothetical protein [Datura stramonium]